MSTPSQPAGKADKVLRAIKSRTTQAALAARTWARASQRRVIGVGIAMLLVAVVVVTILMGQARNVITKIERVEDKVTFAMAREALDHGYYAEARELAVQLRRQPHGSRHGETEFVLGAVAAHSASDLLADDRRSYFAVAARYLEAARAAGFPPGCEAEGLFLLGKSQCETLNIIAGRKTLEEALEAGTTQTAEAHRLLANVYAQEPQRDQQKAVEHITAYVNSPDLPVADKHDGLMLLAQYYWDLNDREQCRAALDQIPPETIVSPDAALLRGRLLLDAARALKAAWKAEPTETRRLEVMAKYDEALQALRRGQDDPLRLTTVRQSMYLAALAYREMEDYRAALAQFIRVRKVYLDTPEGLAAALDEADLQRELEQPDEALAAYRRALGAVPQGEFSNPWIPLEQYRARVLEAYRSLVDAGDFERAVAIAERLSPLFTEAREAQVLADTHRVWALKTLFTSSSLKEPAASEALQRGRALWRKAGRYYQQLADLEFATRQYGDDLWQTAEAYLQGHDFVRAAESFEKYLRHELKRRRPAALAGLAEARLALNDLAGTLAACQECIEFYPNDAAGYRARLLAAQANLEKGDFAAAEALLRQNLTDDRLTPEGREWRDSLFTLGKVLYADGRYEEAILRLQEAVKRYSDTPQAVEARYLVAQSYLAAAKAPQQKLEKDTIETARIAHQRQKQQFLAGAIANFGEVQKVLNQRQEQHDLTPLEKTILRNSYFALGSAQFDMGNFEDALQTYSAASNRYQHDPEVLEAFVQMANCHRRLNRPLEARGALQQAKVVLDRLPADAPFSANTNYNRREWSELLEWLNGL